MQELDRPFHKMLEPGADDTANTYAISKGRGNLNKAKISMYAWLIVNPQTAPIVLAEYSCCASKLRNRPCESGNLMNWMVL
jgi:hypothetical protein